MFANNAIKAYAINSTFFCLDGGASIDDKDRNEIGTHRTSRRSHRFASGIRCFRFSFICCGTFYELCAIDPAMAVCVRTTSHHLRYLPLIYVFMVLIMANQSVIGWLSCAPAPITIISVVPF